MKNTTALPPYETLEIGTPRDYTSDAYRVYFEVGGHDLGAREIIAEFIGSEKAKGIIAVSHGYEIELPIQCVPEIVQKLVIKNIAVYQVVRYAKTNGIGSGFLLK